MTDYSGYYARQRLARQGFATVRVDDKGQPLPSWAPTSCDPNRYRTRTLRVRVSYE